MDLLHRPQDHTWKAYFTQKAYDKVKRDPRGYIYHKDGHEYVNVWENQRIPFIIHRRIAGIDNSLPERKPYGLGCRRAIDDA